MKVKEVMKKVRTIDHNSSVREAALSMKKLEIGSLVVTNSTKPVGIITERDILTKVTASNETPSKIKIKDIMSKPLITLDHDSPLEDAVYLMIKHKIKKVPILNDKGLHGIITSTEVVANSDDIGEYYFFS